jgi:hypothetical protein
MHSGLAGNVDVLRIVPAQNRRVNTKIDIRRSGCGEGKMPGSPGAFWNTMYRQLFDLKVIEKRFDPAAACTLQFAGSN